MVDIILTIPNDKLPRVVEAMSGIYPIELDENEEPVRTDNENAKHQLRKFIIRTVNRHEQMEANEAARVLEDDSLVT